MNFKTTYLLFGVLAAMLLVLGYVLWVGPTAPDESYLFPSAHDKSKGVVSEEDVESVEFRTADGGTVLVTRDTSVEGAQWEMKSPVQGRVERFAVEGLVRQVLEARTEEGTRLTDDPKKWGLDKPRIVVTLKGKGRTFTLNVGASSPGASGTGALYVTSSEVERPQSVLKRDLSFVLFTPDEFRSRDLLSAEGAQPSYLSFALGGKEPIVLEASESGQWRFLQPKDFGPADYDGASEVAADKTPTGVRALLDAVGSLRVEAPPPAEEKDKDKQNKPRKEEPRATGFVENNAEDMKKYGLESDATADLVITVKSDPKKEGPTLLVGKKTGEKQDYHYARLSGSRNVVTIAGRGLEPIRRFLGSPQQVRDHDLVQLPNAPDVVRIRYSPTEEIDLVKMPRKPGDFAPETWKLFRNKEQAGRNADPRTINTLITALAQKRNIKSFPVGKMDPELGLDKPTVVVSLWVDGVKPVEPKKEDKKDEKKDDKKEEKKGEKKEGEKDEKKEESKPPARPELKRETPDVELVFGAPDPEMQVAVRRTRNIDPKGETLAAVPEALLELARAGSLTYLDRTVPPLLAENEGREDVTRLTITLDGKTTEVGQKDPKDPNQSWVFAQPTEYAGRKADGGNVALLLENVNKLRAQSWRALKAEEKDLAAWGLAPAVGKVTLTVKHGEKTRDVSLLLGKETDDKTGVYAKKSDSDEVFVLTKVEVGRFKDSLLDMSVLSFSVGDVESIKLTGWWQVQAAATLWRLQAPTTIELERKEGRTWVAKGSPNLRIEGGKVDMLLASLLRLKATSIVTFKGKPEDKHGLTLEKGALQIEIVCKNKNNEKLTLTLGADEGDLQYATSALPADVFLIGKGLNNILDSVKKNPEFLFGK